VSLIGQQDHALGNGFSDGEMEKRIRTAVDDSEDSKKNVEIFRNFGGNIESEVKSL
jgi:hypothetical protein